MFNAILPYSINYGGLLKKKFFKKLNKGEVIKMAKKLYELNVIRKKNNKEKTAELHRLLEECTKGFGENIVLERCACGLVHKNRAELKTVFEKIKDQFHLSSIKFDDFDPAKCTDPPAMMLLTEWSRMHGIPCSNVFIYKKHLEPTFIKVGPYWLGFNGLPIS